jgi:hypothetical protein
MGRSSMAHVGCKAWMKVRKSGVLVLETLEDGVTPYKIWNGDLFECPECGEQMVAGFASQPVSEHFMGDFDTWLRRVNYTIEGCPKSLKQTGVSYNES